MSSGGGGGGPSTQTVNQNSVPEWMQPYATQMLGNASSLAMGPNSGYQAYTGQRVADINPMQQQAYNSIQQMQPSALNNQSAGMAGLAGMQMGQMAGQNNNFYNPNAYQGVTPGGLQNYQMGGPQNYTGANVNQYMSPYMDQVVNQQKNAAVADYGRSMPNMNAAAGAAGALGGSRNAIMQSEANRNLQTQLQGIQATGSQAGFQNAQQQFNTQQQMQQAANQANLQANLGTQQLGYQGNLQAQQANQAARLQNAGQAAQYGLAGQQLGLNALQGQLGAAGQLGAMGNQNYQQQAGIASAQMGAGQQLQQQQQNVLNVPYQQYLAQQQYPYTQMEFMNSLIHGFAPNTQTTTYPGQPNQMGQLAGLGMGVAGLSSLWG